MTTTTESAVERLRLITEARGTAYRAFRQLAADDKAVWGALAAAHASLTQALGHQAKDGVPDVGGDDGTNGGGGGNTPGIGNQDGTGRAALRLIEDGDMRLADSYVEVVRRVSERPGRGQRSRSATPAN